MIERLACIALMGVIPHLAGCQPTESATSAGLKLYGNHHTMSVYLPYAGGSDVATTVQFRRAGGRKWFLAQPLARIKGDRLAGCIFGLQPDQAYHVRVTVRSGDRQEVFTASAATRPDKSPLPTGKMIYVSPTGNDSAAGDRENPLATITYAMSVAEPGDVVILQPGVYRQSVRITKCGRPDAYIMLYAENGALVTGASEKFAAGGDGDFEHVSGDLYKTHVPYRTKYVAVGDKRLYYWKTLDLLKAGKEEARRGRFYEVKGGWTYDEDTKTLYLRMPDGSDPNEADIRLSRFREGLVLDKAGYIILENLDVGYFGDYCIVLTDSSNCIVRACTIHNARNGLAILGAQAGENLIQDSEFYDTEVFDWPWQVCKAHDPEGSAIVLQGGRGNVIRNNRLHGFFNAVVPSMWGRLDDERFNRDPTKPATCWSASPSRR